jgi:hypothetical protein
MSVICRCGRTHAEHDTDPPFGRYSDDNLPTCPGWNPALFDPDTDRTPGPTNDDAE